MSFYHDKIVDVRILLSFLWWWREWGLMRMIGIKTSIDQNQRSASRLPHSSSDPNTHLLPALIRTRNRCSSLWCCLGTMDWIRNCSSRDIFRRRYADFLTSDIQPTLILLTVGTWFAFKYAFRRKAEKLEKTNLNYGALARVTRDGGFWVRPLPLLHFRPLIN